MIKPQAEVVEAPAVLTPREFMEEVRSLQDWEEWFHRAKGAKTLDEKLGLVHGATNLQVKERYWDKELRVFRRYEQTGPLKFFFEIADGWRESSRLDWRTPEERYARDGYRAEREYFAGFDKHGNRIMRTESEQRQVLARKAYDFLCRNFFDIDETPEYKVSSEEVQHRWMGNFVSGALFSVVQKFFSVSVEKESERAHVQNLSLHGEGGPLNEKHAVSFLLKLAKFLWTWKDDDSHVMDSEKAARVAKNARMRGLVNQAKPWMIEILVYLDKLAVLQTWILELDRSSLAKLKEIAMRAMLSEHIHPVSVSRRVKTVDEACVAGSPAALFLKNRELLVVEHKRLTDIRAAEWRREEDGQKIETLRKKA